MPNWCGNDLIITGPKKHIKRFDKIFTGKDVSFREKQSIPNYLIEALFNANDIIKANDDLLLREKVFEILKIAFEKSKDGNHCEAEHILDRLNYSGTIMNKDLKETLQYAKDESKRTTLCASAFTVDAVPAILDKLQFSGYNNTHLQYKQNETKTDYFDTELFDLFKNNSLYLGGWYNYNIVTFGTKWATFNYADRNNITSKTEKLNGIKTIKYRFDSAWSPVLEFVNMVSEEYPDLYFILNYEEPGCCFMGYHVVRDGETLDSFEGQMGCSNEDLYEYIRYADGLNEYIDVDIDEYIFYYIKDNMLGQFNIYDEDDELSDEAYNYVKDSLSMAHQNYLLNKEQYNRILDKLVNEFDYILPVKMKFKLKNK